MAIHAKPSGAYLYGTSEWDDNVRAFWNFCNSLGYTEEAFSGMMGNADHEGQMNPWRWQNDVYNTNLGYGLFQYTPASGYLNTYGPYSARYSPNLSTTSQTAGATPEDGLAQIEVIDVSGKYVAGSARVSRLINYVPDCQNYTTLSDFKAVNDISKATYLWLGFFEYPGWWRDQIDVPTNFQRRLTSAQHVYDLIHNPVPPTPTGNLILFGGARENIRRNILRR